MCVLVPSLSRRNFVSQGLVAGCLGSHGPSSMRRRKGMVGWWDGDERCKEEKRGDKIIESKDPAEKKIREFMP